jgi:hypothetical protein
MKLLLFALFASLSGLTSAQQCTIEHGTYEGKPASLEVCAATVEDALRADFEGYRSIAYVVRWKGQRIVVVDLDGTSNHAVGDRISFVAFKYPPPGDPQDKLNKRANFWLR